MKIIINNTSMVPIYEQIMEQIKAQIISGELKENDIVMTKAELDEREKNGLERNKEGKKEQKQEGDSEKEKEEEEEEKEPDQETEEGRRGDGGRSEKARGTGAETDGFHHQGYR